MLYLKPLLITVLVALVAGAGWFTRGWYEDSLLLRIEQDRQAIVADLRAGQAKVAGQVEKRLGELKANERVIDRGVIREITKPVYQRVCFEPELVRLLNAAQRGESVSGSAESAGGLSGDAP